jgi:hypothetical protein
MDFNSTVDIIIKDLDEARKIIDDFKNYPDVPLLQIELAKSKCKSASEVISLLKKLQIPSITADKKESTTVKQVDLTDPVEVISRNVDSPVPHNKPVTNKENVAPVEMKPSESSMIADTFNQQSDTLYEQLGNLVDDNYLHDSIKNKPLSRLSEAIGVNDKFLFIKEIFNGSTEAYNMAIAQLDEAGSFDDAKAVLMSYTGENIESDAAGQLLDLVKRKFPGNE